MKEKALEKMLIEMNEKHSDEEDRIHNWLCDQDDPELFEGILKEGKTIKESFKYCIEQAKKMANGQRAIGVNADTVFSWVRDYFLNNETKVNVIQTTETKEKVTKPVAPKKKKEKKEKVEDLQLSLFG